MEPLIIGIGNNYRSDDGVGLKVVQLLKNRYKNIKTLELQGEAVELMENWKEQDSVIVIDAMQTNLPPGTIYTIDVHKESLQGFGSNSSTHAFGLAEAIALSKIMSQLPTNFLICGIEGESFAYGTKLSSQVQKAVEKAANIVYENWQKMKRKGNAYA